MTATLVTDTSLPAARSGKGTPQSEWGAVSQQLLRWASSATGTPPGPRAGLRSGGAAAVAPLRERPAASSNGGAAPDAAWEALLRSEMQGVPQGGGQPRSGSPQGDGPPPELAAVWQVCGERTAGSQGVCRTLSQRHV